MLNADIFQGQNSPAPKIDCSSFIKSCVTNFPSGVLSLGWTTRNEQKAKYTWCILDNPNLKLTFAVRLQWCINSINQLQWLQKYTKSTFTIWSHESDYLASLDSILLLRHFFHPSKVYYDLPGKQKQFLIENLKQSSSVLKSSNNQLVQSYIKEKNIDLNEWEIKYGQVMNSERALLLLSNGSAICTRNQYKSVEGKSITKKIEL